jgi:drug/metabolite transporter (DMT)-like permease
MLWLTLGILTALFYTLYHLFNKKYVAKSSPEYFTYLVLVFGAIITLPFILLLQEHLAFNYYWLAGMIGIGLVVWIGMVLYLSSLKISEVSKTVPLLNITPLFTLIIAMIWLGEFPSWFGISGIILLVVGTYFLNYRKEQGSLFEPFFLIFKNKGALFMFIAALIYSFGAVLDKFIIIHSNVLSRILFYSIFAGSLQAVYLSVRDKYSFIPNTKKVIKENWKGGLIVATLFYLFAVTQMYGISLIHTAYIISLKRISAVFMVIIAYFVFKERKSFAYVLSGAILMSLGVVLMLI